MGREHRVMAVVEDDEDVRTLIRVTLAEDPEITIAGEATTAEEAVTLCKKIQPSLIILDHMLEGGVTGIQISGQLKEAAPNCKILLFSALDLRDQAAESPHIDDFLLKSSFDKLLGSVRRLLGLG